MSGKIYRDTGIYQNIGGGTVWSGPNRSNPVLDLSSTTRLNINVANADSIFANTALVNTITSADITSDNVVVHSNLVSQGRLVGNTGTFNSILSNLFTTFTFTTTDINADNVYINSNIVSLGNASFVRANITSLIGNTATFASLISPVANIAALQAGNVVFSNLSYHSNASVVAPSGNIANLYSSSINAPLANITSLNGTSANIQGTLALGNSLTTAYAQISNGVIQANSISVGNAPITRSSIAVGNSLSSSYTQISNSGIIANTLSVGNTSILNSGVIVVGNSISNSFTQISNSGIIANTLSIGNTSILNTGVVVLGNSLSSSYTQISNSGIIANTLSVGNTSILNTGVIVVGNSISNSFTQISNSGIIANTLSVGSTTISPSGNITLGNTLSNAYSILSNGSLSISNTFTLGNSLANNFTVIANGQLSIGNTASNTFGYTSISTSGIISNSLSVSNGAYVINAQGVFQKSGNAYTTYPNLIPYAQTSQLSQIATSSLTTITGNNLTVYGNVFASFLFGDGSQLTGFTNSQLPSTINVPGAIVSNTSVSTTGNVSANYLFGNGSQITGLPTFSGTISNSQLPTSITISGNIASNSGITANSIYIKGTRGILNVSGADPGHMLVTSYTEATGDVYGIGQYGGGAVRVFHSNTFTPSFTAISSYRGNGAFTDILVVRGNTQNVGIGLSNPTEKLQVSGNVSATFFKGDGSLLTGLTSTQLPSSVGFSSVLIGNTAGLSGGLISGTFPAGNISTPVSALQCNAAIYTPAYYIGDGSYISNIRPTSINGSLTNTQLPSTITNPVSTSGNVSGSFLFGNASQLTGITTSQLPTNPVFSGTAQAGAFYTTGGFFGNISQCTGLTNNQLPSSINLPGTIISNSSITATGNISTPLFVNAGYFFGNGSQLTGLTNTQLPANISCNVLTVSSTFQCTGATTLSGLLCGNINLSRGVGFRFGSIQNADTITSNVGAFPGWSQANTYYFASTQAWGGAAGTGTSTYMLSGNLGASSYFGGTTSAAMPIILANCSLYTWGFYFGDGGYVSNIRGTAIASQITNNRLPTNVNIGGTLQANALTTLGNNLQFTSGAYLANPGVAGNSVSIVWGAGNTSTFTFQSDTNIVAYNKTGTAVWATGAINSDGRFKKNIRNFGNVSSILRNIKPRKFKYNDDDLDREQVGFLVEEVQPYMPEVIQEITNPETGTKNNLLRYEKLSPYLVQAFQEMDARLQIIEKRLGIN
jgi:hypothetical protein